MSTLKVVVFGALGIASCLALLFVAVHLTVRWQRTVIVVVAMQGLLFQGLVWGRITSTLKGFDVGGSYMWLYAALGSSVAGMVWGLALLGATFLGRRLPD